MRDEEPAVEGERDVDPAAGSGAANAGSSEAEEDAGLTDRARRVTWTVLGVCVVFFFWYLVANRFTPYTTSARVEAFVLPIAAEVSGYAETIAVTNNQRVEANDVLLQIQRQRYELAVRRSEAALTIAFQEVGADSEEINRAEAVLAEARSNLKIHRVQAQRILSIEDTGAIAMAYVDQARAEVAKKEAELAAAESELERVRKQVGLMGAGNAQIRSAAAALEEARLDLARTAVRAPSRGMVTDLRIDEGYYVTAGQPLMTFIAVGETWIEAHMTENNLGRIERGDAAEVSFDALPGRTFAAEVVSFGGGAAHGPSDAVGDLPSVEEPRGWLRSPQRFPVIIQLTDPEYVDAEGFYTGELGLRVGSQADVIVYTGDSWILNFLAGLWIRLNSVLSYAY